jgi:hypothetical protein
MSPAVPRLYFYVAIAGGYLLLMFANPVRTALRDGLRCITRYERIWVIFLLLGLAYSAFQFLTFTPLHSLAELNVPQAFAVTQWNWPNLNQLWRDTPLPALEGLAGIFDNATTTYPLSVIAAVLMVLNWRGLHGDLLGELRKRYRVWTVPIYLILLLSMLAALLKPIVYWRLAEWSHMMPTGAVLRISATVDAVSFIFEYLVGVYIQVYLITVCLAWIKGLSFDETALLEFAVRRFTFVMRWALLVVALSFVVVRLPILLAYFMEIRDVLDYLPFQRVAMSAFLLAFCTIQVSLVLHNEKLREAMSAHGEFLRRHLVRLVWFLVIGFINFYLAMTLDAVMRAAIADRVVAVIAWKIVFVSIRALLTGWLLASWVCLFRACEAERVREERFLPPAAPS